MQKLLSELEQLVSEERNPDTEDIDTLSTIDLLRRMNNEDAGVAEAVRLVLPEIAQAVDCITTAFSNGGRLIYIGAGTSGRLGVLDASECPPTFGVSSGMVVGLIAGGDHALRNPVEGAEDDERAAVTDLAAINLSAKDVIVGLAVSGRTPYVVSALRHGQETGATTVSISCNPGSVIATIAQISILPVVGPELLTGSTRLKSGTAQKLVLNMLSTASMVRIGKVYGNLMVDLQAKNDKLVARAARVVMQATGSTGEDAAQALTQADNDVKLAILTLLTDAPVSVARAQLTAAGGVLRKAISACATNTAPSKNGQS